MRRIILIALLASLTPAMNAQQVWSLEKCINHALKNNLQLKQQQLLVEAARADVLQTKLDLLPGVTANASHAYNYGQTIDRYTNQFATSRVQSNNFYLQGGVTLFNGFQKINYIRQTQLDLMATLEDADKYANDLSINIATFYMQVLFYKELVNIRTNQLDITRQQVERMKKLVDAGTMAAGESYIIEAQMASEESLLIQAQNSLDLSLLTLTQLLDLPSTEGFDIEVPDLAVEDEPALIADPNTIYQHALSNRPEIRAAQLREQSSEKSLARARGMLYPSLALSGSWGTGYSGASQEIDRSTLVETPIGYTSSLDTVYTQMYNYTYRTTPWGDQIRDNNNPTIGLYLTIPIFNGWQSRTAVSKSKLALENSRLETEVQSLQLRKTIYTAWTDAKASLKNYDASKKKVNATQESFRYAEQKFNVGIMNSVDYNNAKKDLTNAQSELIQSKYDYIFKSTVLDFYMGKELTLK
ncbi:MAG TPA: TolC family protein [Bacteroidales bacterium]|nr:TolC family protein [Bacteroidales bacterium]